MGSPLAAYDIYIYAVVWGSVARAACCRLEAEFCLPSLGGCRGVRVPLFAGNVTLDTQSGALIRGATNSVGCAKRRVLVGYLAQVCQI